MYLGRSLGEGTRHRQRGGLARLVERDGRLLGRGPGANRDVPHIEIDGIEYDARCRFGDAHANGLGPVEAVVRKIDDEGQVVVIRGNGGWKPLGGGR